MNLNEYARLNGMTIFGFNRYDNGSIEADEAAETFEWFAGNDHQIVEMVIARILKMVTEGEYHQDEMEAISEQLQVDADANHIKEKLERCSDLSDLSQMLREANFLVIWPEKVNQ